MLTGKKVSGRSQDKQLDSEGTLAGREAASLSEGTDIGESMVTGC